MAQTTFTGPVKSDNGFIENSFTTAQLVALPNPTVGLLVYNTTLNEYQVYNGSSFQPAFGPTPPSIPNVTFTNPSFGSTAGGTNISIYGIYFTGATSVNIDGTPLSSFTFINDGQIDGVTGAHAVGSGLSVNVTTPYGTNIPNNLYSYTVPVVVPVITSTSVPGGWVGGGASNFIINGTGFTGTLDVTFNGNSASFTELSDTQILIYNFPGGLTGAADIVVYTSTGTSSPYTGWSYITTGVVTSVTPNTASAAGGTNVTVTGYGFNPTNDLEFSIPGSGSAVATGLSVVNDNELTAVTPNFGLFSGSADVRVFNLSYGAGPYDYGAFTFTPGVPTISNITPAGGTVFGGPCDVIISGSNFNSATSVTIGGSSASFIIIGDSDIRITNMPSGPVGSIDVVVTNSAGPSSPYSWYYYDTPRITAAFPSSGPQDGGTTIELVGYGMTNMSQCQFYGSTEQTNSNIVTVANDNDIFVTTPAHYPEITQLRGYNSSYGYGNYSSPIFTFTEQAPTITNMSLAGGAVNGGATDMVIYGTHFSTATSVTFQGNPATFTIQGPTSMQVTNFPAGTLGVGQIVVTNGAGSSSPFNGWSYVDAPVVLSVSPNSGSPSGGTQVTLTGYGFNTSSTSSNVRFQGASATSTSLVSSIGGDTVCLTTTSSHSLSEATTVAVQNTSGSYGTGLYNGFTYSNPFITPFGYLQGREYSAGGLDLFYTGGPGPLIVRLTPGLWTDTAARDNLLNMPNGHTGYVQTTVGGPPLFYIFQGSWSNAGPFYQASMQITGVTSSTNITSITG